MIPSSLKRIFSPPKFQDEAKDHQAYLLHIILWALIFVPILYMSIIAVYLPDQFPRALAQSIAGETVNIILLVLLRQGKVRLASIGQVAAFWLFFTISAITGAGGGVRGEAYLLGYPLVIIITGVLLGERAALGVAIFSLFTGGCMVYAETQGYLTVNFSGSPFATWAISFVVFPLGAILQYLSARTVRNALVTARASEERYSIISKVSTDYTFETRIDAQGGNNLVWVAGAFEKMTGYTFEEYIAHGGWAAHVHPDDVEKDIQDMEALANNQDVKSEIRTISKNGEMRWEFVSTHPIWDEKENRLVGIVGAVQDITERKKADEVLREALSQQMAILNNIPDMAWLKDRDSRYIAVNGQFEKIAGLTAADIIGKTDKDIWSEKFSKAYRTDDLVVINTKKQKNVEEKQADYTGKEHWVETTKTPIFNEANEVIGTTGIARDITERKESELSEQYRREMLEKVIELGKYVTEADNLKATIKKIWHGVHDDLGYDRLAVFLYNFENNSMDKTVGTDDNGDIVDKWNTWFPIGEETTFSKLLEKPDGFYLTHNYSAEHNVPEGHEMHRVTDFVAVAAWAGKKPVAVICADNSISQRPIAAQQLEALRLFGGYAGLAIENARLHETIQSELLQRKKFIEELETKNSELERFTYTVSHDLKAPLVTIVGFLGYLEKDARAGNIEKLEKDIERIQQAAYKMQNLLKDLLELSRVGRLMNPPVEMSFDEIVQDALELTHGQIESSGAVIEFQDNGIKVNGDRIRLVEVMQNLLDNAIKFKNPQHDLTIQIGNMTSEQSETVFFVKDNGIGIEPAYHEKIFGLFNKLNTETEGTGIGLALVKRIIEVHGGRIWVESQTDKGATFYFTLS